MKARRKGAARFNSLCSGCCGARLPSGNRAVRLGLSANTVPVPTMMASAAARRRCRSARAAALVIHCDDPSAADAARSGSRIDALSSTEGSDDAAIARMARTTRRATKT